MNTPRPRIIVLDDDLRLRELLQRYLSQQGFSVTAVPDAPALDQALAKMPHDLLVLDLMLPGEDGLALCRRLRAQNNPIPIIMLTAKGNDSDRILGLNTGPMTTSPSPSTPRNCWPGFKPSCGVSPGIRRCPPTPIPRIW
jgi:two component transcriptional regulator, winged helix family